MKHGWKTIALAAVLLPALAACSSSTGSAPAGGQQAPKTAEPNEPAKPAEDVKLTFSIWGNDDHKKTIEEIAAKYKTIRPNVTVEVMTIPFNDYQQKLSIMMSSRTAPDIGWLSDTMIPQFLQSGQLADVSSIRSDPAYAFDDMFPSTLAPLTKDGKLYGVPFSTPPSMIFYNKTLFDQKGLKTPAELYKEGRWTYDEMLKAAKAISDPAKGVYGVKLVREWKSWSSTLYSLVKAYGGDVLSKDGTKFLLNSPEGEKAVQLYYDMMFRDGVHPKPGDQTTFESGKLGMFRDVYSSVTKARAIKDFEWDIAPMPKGPNGAGAWVGFAGYAVFQGGKHPKEATEFLKFVSSKESMAATSKYFVPSRKSALESDAFQNAGDRPTKEGIRIAVLEQMNAAEGLPLHKNWQQIDTKVQTHLDYLYTQSASVKEVLQKMEQDVTPLLK